jgi:UDP-glucuronate 4-epimerase
MKILITGAAGFIGFNFCNFLLKKSKFQVVGIDNLNNYYDVKLKKKRLNILKKNRNFKFYKLDLVDNSKIRKIFLNNHFTYVFNFAAQAGVRYSINHPRKYIDSNIQGFFNIIDNCNEFKVKRLFYASSSSVYGENINFPLSEHEKIFPKNIYGLTKKINEEISFIYNKFYKLKTTGLRFFTVYGEWGRPDMMMVKFIECFFKKKIFKLHNYGKHTRDFTYIDDVVQIMFKLMSNNYKLKDNDILNICSNNPVSLKEIINFLKTNKIQPKIKKIPLQKADIIKTHGDNSKLLKYIKHNKFSDWKVSVIKVIEWYKNEMI